MVIRKHSLTLLGLIGLLNACTSPPNQSAQVVGNSANCPQNSASLPITHTKGENLYEAFDYQIRNIVTNADTVTFQTLNHDFVFCRGNESWAVQQGTLPNDLKPPEGSVYQQQLTNPPLKTIELGGETYQYRVRLEPGPSSDGQIREATEVVFELTPPNSEQPQRQTLYTLEDLTKENLGSGLGVPRITAAVEYGDRLFFSVAFEQGEGFSGIATIVSYNPEDNQFTLIQPQEIRRQQITDLAIAGEPDNPVFWLGTQISGEGNPYLPGMGLVSYRPNGANLQSGDINYYNVNNSPIVGAVPNKLNLENDTLWVATGNGICQVKWQAAENPSSWSCDRFALLTPIPQAGIPLYSSLLSKQPATTLSPTSNQNTVEVLWYSLADFETREGRYEVRYPEGFTVTLEDQGIQTFPSDLAAIRSESEPGKPTFFWPGREWHWNGARFERGLDEVALNLVGIGPSGIGSNEVQGNNRPETYALRGDLELLNLTQQSTRVKHYSGWVDDDNINLSLTVVPQERPENPQPNPLEASANSISPQ
jgi:hypothetical protein